MVVAVRGRVRWWELPSMRRLYGIDAANYCSGSNRLPYGV